MINTRLTAYDQDRAHIGEHLAERNRNLEKGTTMQIYVQTGIMV